MVGPELQFSGLRESTQRRIEAELYYDVCRMGKAQKIKLEANCLYFISEGCALFEGITRLNKRTASIMNSSMIVETNESMRDYQLTFQNDCDLVKIMKDDLEDFLRNNPNMEDFVLELLKAQAATIAQLQDHVSILECSDSSERVNGVIDFISRFTGSKISDILIAELGNIRRETSHRLRKDKGK